MYEQIVDTPEYYLPRCETAILTKYIDEIAQNPFNFGGKKFEGIPAFAAEGEVEDPESLRKLMTQTTKTYAEAKKLSPTK